MNIDDRTVRQTHRPTGQVRRLLGLVAVLALMAAGCGGGGPTAAADDDSPAPAGNDDPTEGAPAELTTVRMQLGWIASNNQLGEIVAKHKGFYAEEGIELEIIPGGPSIDGVATVASGGAEIGQLSSSPSLMLAVSQGIPVKAFATGAQEHPYTFFSMPDTPLNTPEDFKGLHVGTQATGEILLNALLAKNGISRDELADYTAIGAEISPLLSGQVDVWTGWTTNTSQLKELPEGHHRLRLWDAGVRLYALPYYARTDFLDEQPEIIEGFIRATAKGWEYARDNYDEAIDFLLEEYPNLERESESEGGKVILGYVFTEGALDSGWGAMDRDVWQDQLTLWEELDQFEGATPALDDVVTTEFLEATADARDVG